MAVAVRVGPATDVRSDHELVAAVRSGDDGAFETLYDRYQRRITAFSFGLMKDWARAEDVTQDVFISALRRMRETERPIAFKPWVYEIAKNACIDQFRRSRRAEEVSYDADERMAPADVGRLADKGPVPEVAAEHKQQLDDLVGAFGGLSRSHHDILVLRELEGLSYRQIGERMGLSRPSVESTLFRARRRLGEEYDDLTTGRRCLGVRATIEEAGSDTLGVRDRGRVSRHLAHCQSCRRYATHAGMAPELFSRPSVRTRVAALSPLPLLLRRPDGAASAAQVAAGAHSGALWGKAVAAALTVAVAGGAGVASHTILHSAHARHAARSTATHAAPASRPVRPAASDPHGTMRQLGTHARARPSRAAHGALPGARVHGASGASVRHSSAGTADRSGGAGAPLPRSASPAPGRVEMPAALQQPPSPATRILSGSATGFAGHEVHLITEAGARVDRTLTGSTVRLRSGLLQLAGNERAPHRSAVRARSQHRSA